MSATPFLEVSGLCRRFGGLKAVDGLSLQVGKGEVLGLLGPNGSGKTTALNLISGVLKPDRGSIRLAGQEVAGLASFQFTRRGMGRTFQLVRVFQSMTVRENVEAGLAFAGRHLFGHAARSRVEELVSRVGLDGRAEEVAGKLTYIDQKRLELARALGGEPTVLLLDEWLAGLNPTELQAAIALIQSLKSEGLAILMVEHVLDAIRSLCEHCVVMNAGAPIASGEPAAVFSDPDVVRAYLGDEHA